MPYLVPIARYRSLDPYHVFIDNLPIDGLSTQIFAVNSQVDRNANDLRNSIGSVGTLSNRLNKSLEADGGLKAIEIDAALHSIGEHLEGGGYVVMTEDERDKLSLIDDEATDITVNVETISTTVSWPTANKILTVKGSSTIAWDLDGTGALFAYTTTSKSLHHIHHYDITPVDADTITPDDINFVTTSIATAYNPGSLRVYINGLRLTEGSNPIGGFYYTESDPSLGTFALNTALGTSDILRIDFDQPIV